MEWLGYLLKVIACQACFLLVYHLLLKPSGMHQWSRYYLLAAIILSFIVPTLHVNVHTAKPLPMTILEEGLVFPFEQAIKEVSQPVGSVKSYGKIGTMIVMGLIGVYVLIVAALMVKFFMNLKVILTQIKKLPYDELKGTLLYETDGLAPFSFFKAVFIPRELKNLKGYDQIIEHELAHARHWHSLDRMLIDLIVALLWFNPFIYWYRNALKAVHEYQADEFVLKAYPDKIAYQEILYLQLFKPALGLANHFNTSLIKKRIVMMNQKRIKSYRWLPVLSIPVIFCISLAFSLKEVNDPVNDLINEHIRLEPVATHLPDFILPQVSNKPEILPVDQSKLERLSSGFGMRTDPITNTRKHHHGIDFSAPTGTDVYATADGVVITARSRPKGYGIMVEISHSDGQYITRYAHLDTYLVKEGQEVKKGEVIARVGSSGLSKGPHLHYEIRIDGKPVDPEDYILDYEF